MSAMNKSYESCMEACLTASAACDECAMECLLRQDVARFEQCIRIAFACSAICSATARMINLNDSSLSETVGLCIQMCERCETECEKFSDVKTCRACRNACESCAATCRELIAQFA